MSRVLTFSRYFPGYHPRKGEPTYFVEKIWKWYYDHHNGDVMDLLWYNEQYDNFFGWSGVKNVHKFQPKHHAIRAGHHWKVGDKFSPRVWSGQPYKSKQITIAPDIEVKKTFDFVIDMLAGEYRMNGFAIPIEKLRIIALNDGFVDLDDFELWFNIKPFNGFIGQIICWNENIQY